MISLSSVPSRRHLIVLGLLLLLAVVLALMLAGPALAQSSGSAPASGDSIPEQMARNFKNIVTGTAGQIIAVLLILGVGYFMLPGRQSVPRLVAFLLVMALLTPVVLSSGRIINNLKSLGNSVWPDSSSSTNSSPR